MISCLKLVEFLKEQKAQPIQSLEEIQQQSFVLIAGFVHAHLYKPLNTSIADDVLTFDSEYTVNFALDYSKKSLQLESVRFNNFVSFAQDTTVQTFDRKKLERYQHCFYVQKGLKDYVLDHMSTVKLGFQKTINFNTLQGKLLLAQRKEIYPAYLF